jgi:hypothetical protein
MDTQNGQMDTQNGQMDKWTLLIGLNDNAKQLLNWCRKISIMNEEEFEAEYNALRI